MPIVPARRCPLRFISCLAVGGLAVATLSVAAPANAVAPIEIQLLNINDFHGRIDANTTRFATTVENLRAQNPHTLLLSAGDNIGASLFPSGSQRDEPTLAILNALGVDSSAVGSHELDGGAADLTGRVSDLADFPFLGANVYLAGTSTPALPEYALHQVGGVKIGVIGVSSQATAASLAPGRAAGLDFGDPVAAVNRVAGQLTDGSPSNGEADIVVAEYHEGAVTGAERGSTLAAEVAKGGAFADIVNNTSAVVDVIFTGRTHATYAWDAPVPSSSATRPIIQTGAFGANIGRVGLTYDPATDTVTAYSRDNVARAPGADLSLPRVAQVKTIVDAALARAVELGNRQIGTQTGDITTAYTGGAHDGLRGTYSGGVRDDRASESTLGNLVAQAMLDGTRDRGADLAVVNPGSLRAELFRAGDTSTYSRNTDGALTLAEAAAVLPFGSTVSLVDVSGAAVEQVFEEQWPIAGRRTTTLRLGTSRNVRVTFDPTAAEGSRVTSIRVNGELIDPTQTYTVATYTTIAAGGDGFSAFSQGTSTDVGSLDRDLFADSLEQGSPIRPDFARHQVGLGGTLPATIAAGDDINVSLSGLDLTSQGSPANTKVLAYAVGNGSPRQVGSFPVSGGTAQVSFRAPSDLAGSSGLALVAEPSHTSIGATLPPIVSSTTAIVPGEVRHGAPVTVTATVDSALVPSGPASLLVDDVEVARNDVLDGVVSLTLAGTRLTGGPHRVRVAYRGDGAVAPSTSATAQVIVAGPPQTPAPPETTPAPPVTTPRPSTSLSLKARLRTSRVVAKKTRARITVVLRTATGRSAVSGRVVRLKAGPRTYRVRLDEGRAAVRLRPFVRPGKRVIRVSYWDSKRRERVTTTVVLRVRKAR